MSEEGVKLLSEFVRGLHKVNEKNSTISMTIDKSRKEKTDELISKIGSDFLEIMEGMLKPRLDLPAGRGSA